jgi:hypothetical protein
MNSYGFWVNWQINFTFTCLLQAPNCNWFARWCRPIALCHTRAWGITRDRQDCHHLPPTPQLWGTRQTKLTFSVDTTSTLSITTLAFMKCYLSLTGPSTRSSATEIDDEPHKQSKNRVWLMKILNATRTMNTHLAESFIEAQVFVEVQARGEIDKSGSSLFSPSHLSWILNSTSYGLSLGVMLKCVLFALMCCC